MAIKTGWMKMMEEEAARRKLQEEKKKREDEKAEKVKTWESETPAQRAARILAEGKGPRRVGSDPDEMAWYIESGRMARSEKAAAEINRYDAEKERKNAKTIAYQPAANINQSYANKAKGEKTAKRAEQLEAMAKEADKRASKLYQDKLLDIHRRRDPLSDFNLLPKLPEKNGETAAAYTAQEAENAQNTLADWNRQGEARSRIMDYQARMAKGDRLTPEEWAEWGSLQDAWGQYLNDQEGMSRWGAAIDFGTKNEQMILDGYAGQQAQVDSRPYTHVADTELGKIIAAGEEAKYELAGFANEAEVYEAVKAVRDKFYAGNPVTPEEEKLIIDASQRYGFAFEDPESMAAWEKRLREGPEAAQAAIEAGEAAKVEAEEGGYITRTAHDERVERKAQNEGELPGYEQSLATYGFDAGEYEKALADQKRDGELLRMLYLAKQNGVKRVISPGALNTQIAQLEKRMTDRAAQYADNWEEWGRKVRQDQQGDIDELTRIQRERGIIEAGNAPNKGSLLKEADRQIEALEADIAGRQDAVIQTQPDFAQHSRPRPEFAKQDAFYAYANFRETQDNGGHITIPDEALKAQFMTDEERSVYNYYYYFDQQSGTDNAGEYLKRIDNRLTFRQSNYTAEQAYKIGKEHPVAGLAVSALTTVLEPAGIIQTGWDALRGKDTNPYGAAFAPGRIKGSMRSGGASGMGDVGGFLYNTAGSLGDMGAAALTGPLMPFVMAGSAGSAAAYDVGTRGGSSGDMLKVGLPAAIVEWGTEKLGFDRLTSIVRAGMKGGKGFLATLKGMGRAWLANFLPEGLEELPGNPLNTLVDNWVMGVDSVWNTESKRLQEEEGLNEEQANRRLWGQLLKETWLEGLAGGIAGGLAGAASAAIGSLNAGKITQEMMTEYPGMDQALVESVVQQEMGLKGRNEKEVKAFEESLEEQQAIKEQPDPFGAGVLVLTKTTKGPVIRENELWEGRAKELTKTTKGPVIRENELWEGRAKEPEGVLPAAAVTGFDSVAGGEATVTLDNGETAALSDLTFDSIEMKQAYEEAASYGDTQTARSFLTGWQYSRMPIGAYSKAFENLFDRGRNGQQLREGLLRGRVAKIAYEAGQAYRRGVEARLETPQAVSAAIQSRIAHLPSEIKPGFAGGVVMQTREAKLSSFQAVQTALMDEYGKRNGVTYVVVDSLGGAANGFYKDGVIYVAADAQEGNLTRAATHEGWHYLKESLGAESRSIKALETFVISRLQRSAGYDLETRIGQVQQIYESRVGQKLDRAGALEEIVADSLFDVFSRRENLEALMAKDETAAKGLIDWVKRFGRQMKEALRRIGLKSPEARAIEKELEAADAMVERYNDLMAEAKAKKARQKEKPQALADPGKQAASAKDSIKFNKGKTWSEQIENYVKAWKEGKINSIGNHSLVLSMAGYPSLTQEGIPDLPLVMEPSVANKALRMEKGSKSAHGEQGISVDTLLGMPEQIKDAKLILRYQRKNGNRAAIVFGTEKADPKAISEANLERYAGKPVCYAIEENVTNDEGIKVNVVTSVHVRVSPEWVGETVLREDPDAVISFEGKKMSRSLTTRTEIVSAANELIDLYMSIYHPDLIVNRKTMEGGKFSITGERAENARYSLKDETWYDYGKPFVQQVEDLLAGKMPGRDALVIGKTPELWQKVGMSALPVTINQTHVMDAVKGTRDVEHNISWQLMKQLPELLEDPIAIIESQSAPTDGAVVIIKAVINGKPYIVPVFISSTSKSNRAIIDSNNIATIFRKENAVAKLLTDAIQKENAGQAGVYYWNKTEARSLYDVAGVQFPGNSVQDGLNHSIFDAGSPVNRKYLEQTETRQFKRWFGKSKVVNGDGSPKVMYHGTRIENGEFDVFNYSHARKKGGLGLKELGKGNYFTSNALDGTERYGSRVIKAWLSIQKPVEMEKGEAYEAAVSKALGIEVKGLSHEEVQQRLRERGYDGMIQRDAEGEIAVAVTFDAEQIKSATDNIGLFDPKNPDIRYSLKDTIPAELDEALMENAQLRRTVGEMQSQLQGVAVNDPKAIRELADKVLTIYGSSYNAGTLARNLREIFDALSNSKGQAEYDQAMQALADVAKAVIEKSARMDNELAEEYSDLRKKLRETNIVLSETQRAEAAHIYGDYNAFRKKYMGRLRLANAGNGMELTELWRELSRESPQFFRKEASEEDMVTALADTAEALKPTYRNPYGMNTDEAANDLALELFEGFLKVPQVTGEKEKQIIRLREQLGAVRREYRDQTRAFRDQTRAFQKVSWDYTEQLDRVKQMAIRRRQNQERAQARGEIARIARSLSGKLLKPTNAQHIPEGMRGAVAEVLRMVDFRTNRQGPEVSKALNAMYAQYEAIARRSREEETFVYDEDIADLMEAAAIITDRGGHRLADMTVEELQTIRDALRAVRHLVENDNRLFLDAKRQTATEAADAAITTLNSWRGKAESRFGMIRAAGDMLQKGLLKPIYFFEQLEGTPIYDAWMNIRKGEGSHTRRMQGAEAFLKDAMKKYGFKDWKLEEELAFDSEWNMLAQASGKKGPSKASLTKGELMTLYATAKREQHTGTQHLEKGGVAFESEQYKRKESNQKHQFDFQTVEALAKGNLTKEQLDFVDELVGYLSTECSKWGNEVSMAMYGLEKFNEAYYIPFATAGSYLKNDPAAGVDMRMKSGGFTQPLTKKAATPLTIRDFAQVWCEHVEKMSVYASFALPLEDFNRIYQSHGTLSEDGPWDQSVKASIEYAMGKRGREYIDNFMKQLNGNNRQAIGTAGMLNKLTSLAKGTAIGFNISVAVQQASAGVRAFAEIDGKYVAAGMVKGLNYPKAYAELKRYAPVAVQKEWGYFDTQMSRGLYDRATGDWRQRVSDAAGWLPQQGDRMNWAQIWEAVKLETLDHYRGEFEKGSQEHLQRAAERFQEVIDHTQVTDSIFQRSEWARSKDGLTKALVSFMSEPITQYNMIWSAVGKWKRAKGMKKGAAQNALIKEGAKGFTGVMVSMALNAALAALVAALRDRENEKKIKDENGKNVIVGVRNYGDKWKSAFVEKLWQAPLSMIPIVSDLSSMWQGYSPSRLDMTTLETFVDAAKQLVGIATGEKEMDAEKTAYAIAKAVSYATGIPFSNVWRDAKAMIMTGREIMFEELLPGAAWDEERPVEARLKAAQANYVMKKQAGDRRKEKTEAYYNLLLAAWYQDGSESEAFRDVLAAMIQTGGTAKGIYTGFKNRLAQAEPLVLAGAEAKAADDYDGYEKAYTDLTEKGISLQTALEMISSVKLGEDEEEAPADVAEEVEAALKKIAGATEKKGVSLTAYEYKDLLSAMESGNAANRDKMLEVFTEAGVKEADIRSQVTGAYRKRYLAAVNGGDKQEAGRIAKLLKESGLDYEPEDLDTWWRDDAYERFYAAVADGKTQEAAKIRQTIIQKDGESHSVWKRTTSYYGKKYRELYRTDRAGASRLKAKLLALGFKEATIRNWEKEAVK